LPSKFIRQFEKINRINDAISLYERLHYYAIKYDEHLFRRDYIMQYLRLVISQNNYIKAAEILQLEIDFLLHSEKCKKDGVSLYIMDLFLVHMITHNPMAIDNAVDLRKYTNQFA